MARKFDQTHIAGRIKPVMPVESSKSGQVAADLARLKEIARNNPELTGKIYRGADMEAEEQALESISDFIRKVVQARGLTAYAVTQKAGLKSHTDIREFLAGNKGISLATAEAICKGLELILTEKKNGR